MAGTGTDFHSELLNFKRSRRKWHGLPKGVKADPPYWINRIKEKTSDGLLAAFERQVKEKVKTGNGGARFDADHEWITFSRNMMSKAIEAQKRGNAKSATEQLFTPYGLAAHGMGTGGRQQPLQDAQQHASCAMDSNARTKAMPKQPMRWIFIQRTVSQHRVKEIIDDPPLKSFVDRTRTRNGNPKPQSTTVPATDGVSEAEARAVRRPQEVGTSRRKE